MTCTVANPAAAVAAPVRLCSRLAAAADARVHFDDSHVLVTRAVVPSPRLYTGTRAHTPALRIPHSCVGASARLSSVLQKMLSEEVQLHSAEHERDVAARHGNRVHAHRLTVLRNRAHHAAFRVLARCVHQRPTVSHQRVRCITVIVIIVTIVITISVTVFIVVVIITIIIVVVIIIIIIIIITIIITSIIVVVSMQDEPLLHDGRPLRQPRR